MRIVDVDISTMNRARSRGRARSPETLQLVEAIDGLSAGKAKAIEVEQGENPAKVRARLMYAAKLAGKKIRVAVEEDRVLFARGPGRPRKNK